MKRSFFWLMLPFLALLLLGAWLLVLGLQSAPLALPFVSSM